MYFSIYLVVSMVAVIFAGDSSSEKPKLPCALQWVEMSRGGTVPENAVLAYKPFTYVARGNKTSQIRVGHYDAGLDLAFVPLDSGSVETLQAFEILVNDYDCLLNWVSSSHPDVSNPQYTIPSEDGRTGSYIGRGTPSSDNDPEDDTSSLVSGSVDSSSKTLTIVSGNRTEKLDSSSYYVLISQSTGLKLVMKNFAFVDDIFGGPASIMGLDEIHNDGAGEVTQSVSHSQSVSEKFSFSSSSSYTVAWNIDMDLGVELPFLFSASVGGGYSQSTTTTEGSTYERETKREVASVRTITVPPFTTIQACTILQNIDDFKTTWNATAEFTSPGLTAAAVIEEVKKDDSWKGKTFQQLGAKAFTSIDGTFSASMALNSKFYLSPSGCTDAERLLNDNKRQRRELKGLKQFDWRKEQTDLDAIFRNAAR